MPVSASPAPAPGESRSIGLALVNTELEPRGEKLDLLTDTRALRDWLRARHLVAARGARITDADLGRIRELRTAVRAVFMARVDGARPQRSAVAAINEAAALVGRRSRLVWRADGPHSKITWPSDAAPVDVALSSIANDAILTVLGPAGARLRACQARGCSRLFIQDHGRRQWCSRACGDRVRFARYYRKARSERRRG